MLLQVCWSTQMAWIACILHSCRSLFLDFSLMQVLIIHYAYCKCIRVTCMCVCNGNLSVFWLAVPVTHLLASNPLSLPGFTLPFSPPPTHQVHQSRNLLSGSTISLLMLCGVLVIHWGCRKEERMLVMCVYILHEPTSCQWIPLDPHFLIRFPVWQLKNENGILASVLYLSCVLNSYNERCYHLLS